MGLFEGQAIREYHVFCWVRCSLPGLQDEGKAIQVHSRAGATAAARSTKVAGMAAGCSTGGGLAAGWATTAGHTTAGHTAGGAAAGGPATARLATAGGAAGFLDEAVTTALIRADENEPTRATNGMCPN